MEQMQKTIKSWKHKNIIAVLIGVLFALSLSRYEPFHQYLINLHEFGYLGAFFAGFLFVSSFTFATGAVILLVLAETLNPVELAFIAGLGGVTGDFLIFRFVKDGLAREVNEIYNNHGGNHISKLFHTKYFNWTLPVIGAIIIASPLPDEIGVSLMGLSKISTTKFVITAFFLDFIGIFLVVSASLFIKP